MENKFKWKAEIEFDGTEDQFKQLAEVLNSSPVAIRIPEWKDRPRHFAGCFPLPLRDILGKDPILELAGDSPRIANVIVQGIAGGRRTPHLHIGDEIVLLNQDRFRRLAVTVAQELAQRRVEALDDYVEVMDSINRIGITPTEQL